jgi:hypothetical protein
MAGKTIHETNGTNGARGARKRTTKPAPAVAAPFAPSHDDIARRAYERWEARGRQHGHEVEDWLAAEAELLQVAPGL